MCAMLRNVKGISKLSMLILLLTSGIVGAVFSYMWTVGYYVDKEWRLPENVVTVTIMNVTFPSQNCTYFNVNVLNPSSSEAAANITNISMIAETNGNRTVYDISKASIEPSIPYILERGKDVTFKCYRNWGEFANQTVYVGIHLKEGSGATEDYDTRPVKLEIIRTEFDTTVTIERFNMTVRNSAGSISPLNVSQILFDSDVIPSQNITIEDGNNTLPLQLQPGQNKTFTCHWNLWKKGALGASHTVTVKTLQGYSAVSKTPSLPSVSLTIANVTFNASDTSGFNVTLSSSVDSLLLLTINRMTITNGTQTFDNITVIGGFPRTLAPNMSLTLQCLWNWEAFKGQEIKVTAYTTQGFYAYVYATLPDE